MKYRIFLAVLFLSITSLVGSASASDSNKAVSFSEFRGNPESFELEVVVP